MSTTRPGRSTSPRSFRRLDAIGYRGKLAVEYFSLPDLGWPLEDPVGWAVDLAAHVRPLLV